MISIIVGVLMVLDFFGVSITDDYVEGNMIYAEEYLEAVSEYVTLNYGYVSLNRILYFYNENDNLTFKEIYIDNLDSNLKQVSPISDVCRTLKYSNYIVCDTNYYDNQIDDIQIKPFILPVYYEDINKITSFFMEERIVFDEYDIHTGWDISASAETNVYAVCDGEIITSSFKYLENEFDINGGYGNYIVLKCEIGTDEYLIKYAHLYSNSSIYNIGDYVTQGDLIAGVGTTGSSTGNHLHFEVYENDELIDGFSLIDFTISDNIYKK